MLKIGIQSVAYFTYKQGEIAGMERAKKHGYDCLDYGDFTPPNSEVLNLPMEQYKEYLCWLKKQADKIGITFNQAHGLWWMNELNLEERKKNIEYYKKQIIGCSFLGCPNLVIHPCCPGGWIWTGVMDDKKGSLEANLRVLEAILPTAKEHSVTICLENLPFQHYSLSHTSAVKEIVRLIDDKNVKICFDTGHSNCMKEDVYQTLKLIGNDLACLHIHDDKNRQDRHLIPFLGEVDWEGFTKGLKEIAFDGVISLETSISPKMPEPMKETMQKSLADVARHLASKV